MELRDEFCDPSNPRKLSYEEVVVASGALLDSVKRTPCTKSESLSKECKMEIYLKEETLQVTGSCKDRGARYALLRLTEEQKKKGVVAAGCGNCAMALAYHGRDLGIGVTVVMPVVTPSKKTQRCRDYGAKVIVKGADVEESQLIAISEAQKYKLSYINGSDHPDVLAGQGTIGLEIVEQVGDVDAVVVPVGGGGLLAAVATAVKENNPAIQVIGAESSCCASFTRAMDHGSPQYTRAESTIAEDLAVPTVGVNAFETAHRLTDRIVQVSEGFIALAILRHLEEDRCVVEGSGATGLAAVLQGLLPELEGKRVVIIVSGGNMDISSLGRCLERGLAVDGRLCRFVVTVSDRPGGLAELTNEVAQLHINIREIQFERAWLKNDVHSVKIHCVVESTDRQQAYRLYNSLRLRYGEGLVAWDVEEQWPGPPDVDLIERWNERFGPRDRTVSGSETEDAGTVDE